MDLGDGVFDLLALDGFLDRAILDLPLQADELPLLERLGEVGEIAPGIDAVPFGAGFIIALVVLPALAGSDAEDGVVLLVLRGFDFCPCCSSGQRIPRTFAGSMPGEMSLFN